MNHLFDPDLATVNGNGNLPIRKQKIAVVGAGIAGLGAAYSLSSVHDVTLFEALERLGGHSRTLMAGRDEQFAVDTGFMVFNYLNYPNLNALFEELDIPVKRSNMSFAVSLDGGKFEYGLHQLSRVFAQKRNLANPVFYRMLSDIFKFNKHGLQFKDHPDATLGEILNEIGVSRAFRERYLCPLAGAIWSTTLDDMLDFPAQTLVRFFDAHKLMSASNHPTWYTVDGGSQVYVERMATRLEKLGCDIRTNAPVKSVTRNSGKVQIRTDKAEPEEFDQVIFACHSDQALCMLADASTDETDVLSAIRFKKNTVFLHDDPGQMPVRKACWSSWVYKGSCNQTTTNATTYWMNLLQDIPETTPVFVTLNPENPIPEEHIFNQTTLSHPQYDMPALRAREKLPRLQGQNNSWYCGAWTKYGFHEDGLASGLKVAEDIRAKTMVTV